MENKCTTLTNILFVPKWWTSTPLWPASAVNAGSRVQGFKGSEGQDADSVRAMMREHAFDVLPVESLEGRFIGYWRTTSWGDFSTVGRHDDDGPRIYFRTPVAAVIERLSRETPFLFLEEHADVVGLITIANLNCAPIRVFVYGLIASVEMALAKILGAHDGLHDRLKRSSNDQIKKLLQEHEENREAGFDLSLSDHLYTRQLFYYANDLDACELPDWVRDNSELERLIDIRNRVAHPNRTLVTSFDDLDDLKAVMRNLHAVLKLVYEHPIKRHFSA